MSKLKRTILISSLSIITLVVLVILFISPIAKYAIEKYDVKFLGREITMDWAYVNPFTGYIHFSNVQIKEEKSDSIFFSAKSVSANIAMLKIFSKTYEISEITLNEPRGIIIQNQKLLNFTDLINKFTTKEKRTTPKISAHVSILGIKIIDGEFYYREQLIPVNYFIKNVNIESTGKNWDADTLGLQFSFLSGIKTGAIKGDFTINFETLAYHFAAVANKFNLNIIQQYLKGLTNYGTFTANLDANIKANGNFKSKENISAKGMIAINAFHFGKNVKEDYASFDKVILQISELSPKNHKYNFDSVSLTHPYFKYERYDYLDNLQTMFGKNGANIKNARADNAKFNLVVEIARYVKVLAKNFFRSNYKIGRLAIYNGDLKYNDFTLNEKFSAELSPLFASADSIDKNHKRVKAILKSGIKPYGNLLLKLGINPKDSSDFDIQYHFEKIPLTLFNPYLITYTSFPMDRGTIELNGKWTVINGNIESKNHLIVIDPRLTTRMRNKNISWLPMRLVKFFVRERGNVIDYEVPVTGNLKDPTFHLRDVLVDVVENIFVKPAAIPYTTVVTNTEAEIEKSLSIKWAMRTSTLSLNQERFVERIADFLKENPQATVSVSPQFYSLKEKEYILFFEAKKKYYMMYNKMNTKYFFENDSMEVNKMSIKDSMFSKYLNEQIKDSMVFTIQEKCSIIIDSSTINKKLKDLNTERKIIFLSYFIEQKVEKQIIFVEAESVIPYNGFSFYKIKYKNEFPESLLKAYRLMNELNDELPRLKFKQMRKRSKNTS